jgi:hypothetical protein
MAAERHFRTIVIVPLSSAIRCMTHCVHSAEAGWHAFDERSMYDVIRRRARLGSR